MLALKPDGVFLSNGPGDPEPVTYAVETIRKLLGRVPIFGICLGHQTLRSGAGRPHLQAEIRPSRLESSGEESADRARWRSPRRITVSCVDPDSLPSSDVEITHVNLNDNTNEGMRHRSLPLFSVQYHPEASPGPHDSHYLFRQFTDMMKEHRKLMSGALRPTNTARERN